MRPLFASTLLGALVAFALGCERRSTFDGPTVDKFTGCVVANGKAVQFPEDETVQLKLFHEKGQSFNIPLNRDGTFDIGWMPIGKYSANLLRLKTGQNGQMNQYGVPDGMSIKEGETQYRVELGRKWKP